MMCPIDGIVEGLHVTCREGAVVTSHSPSRFVLVLASLRGASLMV